MHGHSKSVSREFFLPVAENHWREMVNRIILTTMDSELHQFTYKATVSFPHL